MTSMSCALAIAAGVVVASALATAIVLRLSRWRLVDIPNHRSSHLAPTPKGGGIAIVLCTLATVPYVDGLAADIGERGLLYPALAGLLIAAISFIDDVRPLAAGLRLAVQLACTGLVLWLLSPTLRIGIDPWWLPGYLALPLAGIWLVWMTNLYNFMDGIDGLAALQAILAGGGLFLLGGTGGLSLLALFIAAACLGFSLFNFPPARLFMGDTGSAFLGFMFGFLTIAQGAADPQGSWLWLILLAGFVSDASCTLVNRLFTGQKIYQAHRSHVYQRFVQRREGLLRLRGLAADRARSRAHRHCLLLFAAVFCLWQLPFAWFVASGLLDGALATLIVYLPLLASAQLAGAGRALD